MYNCGVQVHKCIYEALLQLIWRQFIPWITSKHLDKLTHQEKMKQDVEKMCESFNVEQYKNVLSSNALLQLYKHWKLYLENLCNTNGRNMSCFCVSYINVVGEIFALLDPSREEDWLPHLNAIHKMIPWYFAYDKVDYARYLCYTMHKWRILKLNTKKYIIVSWKLNFTLQLSKDSRLGSIPVD